MLPEELLKPRYELIADFPGNTRPVGFVFVMDSEDSEGRYTTTGYLLESFFTQYPHLFKPLEWWEERKAEDMPAYVKYAENGFIAKVDHFDLETTSAWFMYLEGGVHPYSPGGSALENTYWLPATEAEYLEYIKTKA